jgi:hypothetical protein
LRSRLPPGQYTPKPDCPVENRTGGKPAYDRAVIKVKGADEVKKRVNRLYPTESVSSFIFASGLHFSYLKKYFA